MRRKSGSAGGSNARCGPAGRPSAHHRLLKAAEIEEQFGIPRGTLKSWVARGHLKPFARQGRTYLFRESDVLGCERERHWACRSGPDATIMGSSSGV